MTEELLGGCLAAVRLVSADEGDLVANSEPMVDLAYHLRHEGGAGIGDQLVEDANCSIMLEQSDCYSFGTVVTSGVRCGEMTKVLD